MARRDAEYQPGGHLPHEDTTHGGLAPRVPPERRKADTPRYTDVDQGSLPPRTVPAADEPSRRPDEESPR